MNNKLAIDIDNRNYDFTLSENKSDSDIILKLCGKSDQNILITTNVIITIHYLFLYSTKNYISKKLILNF